MLSVFKCCRFSAVAISVAATVRTTWFHKLGDFEVVCRTVHKDMVAGMRASCGGAVGRAGREASGGGGGRSGEGMRESGRGKQGGLGMLGV